MGLARRREEHGKGWGGVVQTPQGGSSQSPWAWGGNAGVRKHATLERPPGWGWEARPVDYMSRGAPRPLPGPMMPCGAPDAG